MGNISNSRILVIYPHGIGDVIMGTPAFRALRRNFPNAQIGIAVQSGAWHSGIVHKLSYFNDIYLVNNPHFSNNYDVGLNLLRKNVSEIAKLENYTDIRWVLHKQDKNQLLHKVDLTATELSVTLDNNNQYDFPIDEKSKSTALQLMDKLQLKKGKYAFLHTHSTDLVKNKLSRIILSTLPDIYKDNIFIINKSFDITNLSIEVSAVLMNHAGYIGIVDSAFLHIANALKKNIDILLIKKQEQTTCYPRDISCQKEIVINEPNIIDLIKRRIAKITLQLKSVHIANVRKLFGLLLINTKTTANILVDLISDTFYSDKDEYVTLVTLWFKVYDYQNLMNHPFTFYYIKSDQKIFVNFDNPFPVPFNLIKDSKLLKNIDLQEILNHLKQHTNPTSIKNNPKSNIRGFKSTIIPNSNSKTISTIQDDIEWNEIRKLEPFLNVSELEFILARNLSRMNKKNYKDTLS